MSRLLSKQPVRPVSEVVIQGTGCHIGSMVVYCKPDHKIKLLQACDSLLDITAYAGDRETAIVLVIEREDELELRNAISIINSLPGVINASLVYHHCDSSESLSEELST